MAGPVNEDGSSKPIYSPLAGSCRTLGNERPIDEQRRGYSFCMTSWLQESTPEEWNRKAARDGPDHEIADCGSSASHERRLAAILRAPIRPGQLVLDFGCGTARLADLLPAGARYEGVDWSQQVVNVARQRRPGVAVRVGTADDLVACDWIVASGPFNYSTGWSREATKATIERMAQFARIGIALTTLRSPGEGRLHYSEMELLAYLETFGWTHLEFDRSYLPNDVCVRAWRDKDQF